MFSQTVEYALRAMACLAQSPGGLVPTTTLASQSGVPANYLAKVLQLLATAGLVTGRRGVGGGYRLAKQPGQIRLMDVIHALAPSRPVRFAASREYNGVPALAALNHKFEEASRAIARIFEGSTLEDLAGRVAAR
jgi:Rrf2 family nitric oxide-sensitive transcriptional repressor